MSRPAPVLGVLRSCCDAVMCAPPPLPGGSRFALLVDRALPRGGGRCVFFVAIALGLAVPNPIVAALVTLVASAYCLANFWRCREAHCIVSGAGWALLALGEIIGAATRAPISHNNGNSLFLAILAAAIAFEVLWRVRSGSNAVR